VTRQWRITDLVVDHRTGKLRESAVWSNIGKASMTWAFVHTVASGHSSEWLWIAYGGIVVAHASVERVLGQRQQSLDNKKGAADAHQ
jgi:drug/metabolite transporter superfamily protein YnfA